MAFCPPEGDLAAQAMSEGRRGRLRPVSGGARPLVERLWQ